MIEVRCFDSFAKAAFLRDEINALNRLSARPDPFSTFEFLENFFHHDEYHPAGRDLHLWFLTAFEEGRLIGYVALKRVSKKIFGIHTSMIGFFVTHDTDRPHLVARREHASSVSEVFYAYLLKRKREWSFLEFQQQDADSPLFPPPAAVKLSGYMVRQWPSMENGTLYIRWNSLFDYFQALSRNSRTNVRRLLRRLCEAGQLELLTSADASTTPLLFELYRSIEPHSWKSKAQADIGRHPERIEYFKGLLDPKQTMRISIHILLLDGVPIAGFITGAYLNGLYALHIVYDERLSRLAPGSAILLMGIRQAIDGGFEFFNLLSGFSYYKSRWLAQITETRIGQIYRIGGILFWHRVLGDWKRRLFAASDTVRASFNPARRIVVHETETDMSADLPLPVSATERVRLAALVAQIRQGQGEFLSVPQLIAAMPLDKPKKMVKAKKTNLAVATTGYGA